MLLAIGMTLVIATGGVDLSVGAVMAIAASVAAIMMNPYHRRQLPPDLMQFDQRPEFHLRAAVGGDRRDADCGHLCGLWNGVLVPT